MATVGVGTASDGTNKCNQLLRLPIPLNSDNKPGQTITRRTIIKGTTSLGVMLAAGIAPSFIREAGASTMRKVDFMLPWLFVGGHTFEFAAQAEGWKKRGLDVSIQRGYGSGAAIKAVSSKTVNFAEASYGVAVNAVSKGLDVIAIGAKLQKSPIAVSCRKDSGVRSPKDLHGKTLVSAAASGDTLMFPGFVIPMAKCSKFPSAFLRLWRDWTPPSRRNQAGVRWVQETGNISVIA